MSDLTWEEPPRAGDRRTRESGDRLDRIAHELRANPGQWARIAEYDRPGAPRSLARLVRTGGTRRWQPAGSFESVSRTVVDKFCVYARYVGEESADV